MLETLWQRQNHHSGGSPSGPPPHSLPPHREQHSLALGYYGLEEVEELGAWGVKCDVWG